MYGQRIPEIPNAGEARAKKRRIIQYPVQGLQEKFSYKPVASLKSQYSVGLHVWGLNTADIQ